MRISRRAKRDLSWIVLLLACIAFMVYLFVGDGGYLTLREYEEELARARMENQRLREAQLSLQSRIERLRNDPQEIERVARERYHLARPGDIIVNLPE
jgi:cell division protein FtsB